MSKEMKAQYGKRCSVVQDGCPVCDAWAMFDKWGVCPTTEQLSDFQLKKRMKKQLKKLDKWINDLCPEDEAVVPASPAERQAVYNMLMDEKINGMLLAAEVRAVPNAVPDGVIRNLGLSACKSPNGVSIRPVESEGDTEVCISLEDGVLNIRVYNFGHDDYSAALIVPASTR